MTLDILTKGIRILSHLINRSSSLDNRDKRNERRRRGKRDSSQTDLNEMYLHNFH